jgi:hypothetical protein
MKIHIFVLILLSFLIQSCASAKKTNPTSINTKESDIPAVTKPKVNCTQVPDTIEGNKWIEKHRVCIIDSPSTWSR